MIAAALIGKELGNYVVRALLGEGGMGAVFTAEHRFLGTQVAIKVLHGSYSHDPEIAQRFFHEAKASLTIGHPGIIKILDFGQTPEGTLYLVMELLEGRSLGRAIAEGPFGERRAARIGADIADALAAAHDKNIVHRDLKPDNVFLCGEQVKVLDFGIAKLGGSASATKSSAVMGTPRYMAPEQVRSAKHVGPAADVYALGAILFEMLTGRPPFEETDLQALLVHHLMDAPPAPSSLVEISPEMDALVLQCLSKDPAARPRSMSELRDRLAARAAVAADLWTPRAPVGAVVAGAGDTPVDVAASTLQAAAAEILQRESSTPDSADRASPGAVARPRRAPLMIGAIGVAALAVGSALVLRRTPGPSDSAVARAESGMVEVQIASEPAGATVSINGAEQPFRTPSVFKVPRTPSLVVVMEKEGFARYEETVVLRPGDTARVVSATLKALALPGGRVRIATSAPRARWTIDGVPASEEGGTLVLKQLSAGRHRLRVEAKGFAAREEELVIEPGQAVDLVWALAAAGPRPPSKGNGARIEATRVPPSARKAPTDHVGATDDF